LGTLNPLTEFPDQLTAGMTWLVQRSYADYPASQGWVVAFTFVNATTALPTQTCTAVNDDQLLTVAASVTAGFAPGTYYWQAVATSNDVPALVEIAESGRLDILPLFSATGASDQRTHAQKMLDMIQALLEGKALSDVAETDIRTGTTIRHLKTLPVADLMAWKHRYTFEVAKEKRDADNARGVPNSGLIYGEFKEHA
jgi:hypothetical protein